MQFNLSEWALKHRSFVVYLMLVVTIAGVTAYLRLGRNEESAGQPRPLSASSGQAAA